MIELTPLDVRKKKGDFRRILRGYDPGEVDSFLGMVEARFEALVMENLSLTEKAQRLASQLEALEGREKAVQEALVTAQKLREDVQDQSAREAESLRNQAQTEADSLKDQALRETEAIRGDAHREASILRDEAIREAAAVRDEARRETELLRREVLGEVEARVLEADGLIKERRRALEELERSRSKFLKGFRNLLEREMDAVEVEESRKPLDETPLELNFKSWSSSPDDEAEVEESEGGDDALESLPAYEPVIDLDGDGEESGEEEESGPQGWGAFPGDEPPEGEFSDIVPLGVFEPATPSLTEISQEGAEGEEASGEILELDASSLPASEEDGGSLVDGIPDSMPEGESADGREDQQSQPRWLFSLLKSDEATYGQGSGTGAAPGEGEAPGPVTPEPIGEGEDPEEMEPRID